VDFVRVLADGGEGCGFDGVTEARGEADGAEHAEFVFGKTTGRLADGADDSGGEVTAAADEVENLAGIVAHEKAVDGEIAALDVSFRSQRIDNLVGMAAVGVADIGAEGGDFNFEGILADEDDPEMRADIEAVGKKLQDFLRRSICGDVVIRRLAMEKDVADTAADEESLVAVALKRVANRIGEFPGIHEMIMRLGGWEMKRK
jgi:hypothetical protein